MKVITNKVGGLAINPQTILYFKKGDVFEAGTQQLTETNIARLIELGFADEADEVIATNKVVIEIQPEETAEELQEEVGLGLTEKELSEAEKLPEGYDFETITSKSELDEYAKEIYSIELNTNQSLKKMIAALKDAIEKEGDK